jgi:hypothetical protein
MATEGWMRPIHARRTHYFVERVSLCGVWEVPAAKDTDFSPSVARGTRLCRRCMARLVPRAYAAVMTRRLGLRPRLRSGQGRNGRVRACPLGVWE